MLQGQAALGFDAFGDARNDWAARMGGEMLARVVEKRALSGAVHAELEGVEALAQSLHHTGNGFAAGRDPDRDLLPVLRIGGDDGSKIADTGLDYHFRHGFLPF